MLKYNVESSNPMTKDSFVFKSFIESPLYLTPEDEEALADEVEPEVLEQINEEFPNKLDWLGLENILIEKDTEYKGSLWYDTMRDNGFVYDSSMNLPESDLNDRQNTIAKVIEKTNRLTRVFVEKHRDEIQMMSDENALKMVALYATCILNQQCGSWYNSNTLYPLFLNYEEFNLEDIMTACYASVQDRAEAESINIVDYVLYKTGALSVLILMAAMTLTGISTIIMGLSYSIFYILAGISMIYRFSRSLDLNSLFSGYLKSTIIVFLCNLTQTIMFLILKTFFIKYTFAGLIVQLLVSATILETLINLLYAIIRNPSELGNSRMLEVMPRLLRKMHVDRLMANLGSLGHKLTGRRDATPFYEESDAYKEFRQGATLSDLYNSRNLSRRRASSINNINIDDSFFDDDHSNDNGS